MGNAWLKISNATPSNTKPNPSGFGFFLSQKNETSSLASGRRYVKLNTVLVCEPNETSSESSRARAWCYQINVAGNLSNKVSAMSILHDTCFSLVLLECRWKKSEMTEFCIAGGLCAKLLYNKAILFQFVPTLWNMISLYKTRTYEVCSNVPLFLHSRRGRTKFTRTFIVILQCNLTPANTKLRGTLEQHSIVK